MSKKAIAYDQLLCGNNDGHGDQLTQDNITKLAWCAANINRIAKDQKIAILSLFKNTFHYELRSSGPNSVYLTQSQFNNNDVGVLYSWLSGQLN